jgi:23S rRNA (pseudouridine1915-N3)-methyltransferase
MKVTLIMVGKTKEDYVKQGLDDYINRIKRYFPFEIKELAGLKSSKKMSEEEVMQNEGKAILKSIKDNAFLVLLDEKGKEFSSEGFARWLQNVMNQSTQNLYFVIGGAYGFSPGLQNRADMKISLSRMTFSHQIIRLIFAEQLYRALTIIKGEPYHHGS